MRTRSGASDKRGRSTRRRTAQAATATQCTTISLRFFLPRSTRSSGAVSFHPRSEGGGGGRRRAILPLLLLFVPMMVTTAKSGRRWTPRMPTNRGSSRAYGLAFWTGRGSSQGGCGVDGSLSSPLPASPSRQARNHDAEGERHDQRTDEDSHPWKVSQGTGTVVAVPETPHRAFAPGALVAWIFERPGRHVSKMLHENHTAWKGVVAYDARPEPGNKTWSRDAIALGIDPISPATAHGAWVGRLTTRRTKDDDLL